VPLKNALIIPQKATFEVLDQKYVYVIDKNNVLKTRRVYIGAELPDLYVISNGLDEKDKILLEGLRLANENDTIHYEFKDPKYVTTHLKLHAE
jgi:membrane fusion protein (multidrug efflux system)